MTEESKVKSAPAGEPTPAASTAAVWSAEERDRHLYQAVLAYTQGRYQEAEAGARALRVLPGFFPATLLLGMIAGKAARLAEGIELLREAVRLDPRSVEARNELATLLRAQGSHDEAIASAKHAVRLAPEDPASHNNLGLCYLVAGRLLLAVTHFERALALKPEGAMIHHNLALALAQQGRELEAIAALRRALALEGNNVEVLGRLGQLLMKHGQLAEATACYEHAAALQPDPAVAAVQRAEVDLQRGRTAQAEACLRAALADHPRSDLIQQVLGVLLQRFGRFDEANASFERALELQPRRVSVYSSLVRGKRITTADAPLITAMEALVRDPSLSAADKISLHFTIGKAYDDLGDYRLAMDHFERANALEREQMRQAGRWFDRRAHARFIERTIDAFGPERFARHAGEGSTSELPVFIVGMPRSGTTLVEQILSTHPQIGAAGELSYWTDRRLLGVEPAGAASELKLEQLAEEYLRQLSGAAPAAERVTDKMPANFLALGLIHLALPRARIIHCRRHPLDTCLSIYATPLGNPLDFAHDPGNLVFFYQQYRRVMAHWRQVIPADRLLEIDYERLVSDPERFTRTLIEFCGMPWDEACLHPERSEHLIMTPSVWQARQPVYRDALERWRRYEPWLGAFRRLVDPASAER